MEIRFYSKIMIISGKNEFYGSESQKIKTSSNDKLMDVGPGAVQILPIDVVLLVDQFDQFDDKFMGGIALYNNIKFPFSQGPLIIFSLLCIENWQNVLVIVAFSHVNITDKITHKETILSFIHMVHHFVLVIRVNQIPFESDVTSWLKLCLIITVRQSVSLQLVWMDRYIPVLFVIRRKRKQTVENHVADPTADDVQRNIILF